MLVIPKNAECKFVTHINSFVDCETDYHLIKQQIHNPDGTTTPSLRVVKDYLREFYITKKAFRNHKEKKEYEDIDKVNKYTSTQSKLTEAVAKALGKGWSKDNLRKLNNSPYVYCTDLPATGYIKKEYQVANPNLSSEFTVATFDIEFNVLDSKQQIIMVTIAMKDKVFTSILKSFVIGLVDVEGRIERAMARYLGPYVDKRNIKAETMICETEIDMVVAALNKAHEWRPDFLAIWNIDYDINRIIEACDRAKIDPKDIFSDPSIPKELRFFKYKQGQKKKVTAAGKTSSIPPSAQWHIASTPASFYIIDAMLVYRQIRSQEQEEHSYSLNAILTKELGIRKLEFKETDQYSGLDWHRVMQRDYKIEYIVYNRFDCISMLELDEKVKDLAVVMDLFSGISGYDVFPRQPTRLCQDLTFYVRDQGLVMGSTGSDMSTPFDSETLSLNGWILALSPTQNLDTGIKCIEELPDKHSNVKIMVSDLDILSTYPNLTICGNVSRATTKRELIRISGISEYNMRMNNINLPLGQASALEYSSNMFNLPTLTNLLKDYTEELNNFK